MAASSSPLSIFHDVPGPGDRRRTLRHKIHSPAYASFGGIGGGMVLDLSEITDLSEDGMCIQSNVPLEVDRTLNLVLDLAETKTYLNLTGHVVWSDQTGRSGIRFDRPSEIASRQLKTWLFFNTLTALSKNKGVQPQVSSAEQRSSMVAERNQELAPENSDTTEELPRDPEAYNEHVQLVADAPTLNEIRQDIEGLGKDVDAALDLIASRTRLLTRSAGTAIALASDNGVVCRASSGEAPPVGARFQVGSGFSGECVRTGELQRCDDSETDPLVDRESCRALGIRSMIAAPVISGATVIGLIEVFSPHPFAFQEGDAVALGRLTDIVAQVASTPPPAPVVVEPQLLAPSRSFSRETMLLITAIASIVLAIAALVAAMMRNQKESVPVQSSPPAAQQTAPAPEPQTLDELRKFADQGDPVAQFALGARYAQGDGVKQDYAEAVRWFKKAADQGHVVAQATLGAYYWAGRGVNEDLSKAYFWSVLARAGGDEASKYRVAALTSRMSRPQVLEAEQQANDWLRQHQVNASTRSQ